MRHRSSSAPIFAMPNSNLHSNSLILSGYLNRPYPTQTLCVFHLGFGLGLNGPGSDPNIYLGTKSAAQEKMGDCFTELANRHE